MEQIRVLVVDDSHLARGIIGAILSTDKDLVIVGEARNGMEAVQMTRELRPNIVTMDIEMPVMNGLEAIEQIMATNPVPILVVTTRGDAHTAYAAISKGALDLVQKPEVNLEGAREFIDKIKLLSKIKVIRHISVGGKTKSPGERPKQVFDNKIANKIIAVASSTGGPEALSVLLSTLPGTFSCPVVIAQHISDGFVHGMVEWLKRVSGLNVKTAFHGESINPGTVYVSPSERHMEITADKKIALIERDPKDIYRPSCDQLLSSAAKVYRERCIGVILTGMGSDGALGIKRIKESGGFTIAQDEKTSVVFGMNKVAIDSGYVDKVLPIEEIGNELINLLRRV